MNPTALPLPPAPLTPASAPIPTAAAARPALTAAPAEPAAAASRIEQALLSLHNSRLALRAELIEPPSATGPARRHKGNARLWWRRLRAWPAGRLAAEALRHWWQRHPWQPLGDTLLTQGREQLWPLLRRHPWASVGAAAAVGAAVVTLRPWRWPWVDRQVRQAPGRCSGWLLRQLGSLPVQAALASLLATAAARQAPATATGPAPMAAPMATPGPEPGAPHAAH
ncbi:hypothetical protein [Aquabacterium sp. OR-4]|uniref:hypothetical protein n=1 Tax=Aquabacterium sp. OR-4 TaxID=2978127 RepID=UPI0021B2F6AC|nr:hypothetical protein [Aquabacterium sp. OR-4]MDT7835037.1 hypothetical protein [Aquabacterium sp. OR-4]